MNRRRLAASLLPVLLATGACASSGGDEEAAATVSVTVTVTQPAPGPGSGDDGVPDPVVPGPNGDDGVPEADDAPQAISPLAPGGARAAIRGLTTALGYTPQFVAIGLYGSYAIFRVRDRDKPGNVDAYTWREGALSGPEPVSIRREEVAARAFRLRDVAIDAVPRLVARAERVDIEDPEVGGVIIERGFGDNAPPRFLVNVSGPRESAQLRADARGRVTEILR
jgi:hypothetical protein